MVIRLNSARLNLGAIKSEPPIPVDDNDDQFLERARTHEMGYQTGE